MLCVPSYTNHQTGAMTLRYQNKFFYFSHNIFKKMPHDTRLRSSQGKKEGSGKKFKCCTDFKSSWSEEITLRLELEKIKLKICSILRSPWNTLLPSRTFGLSVQQNTNYLLCLESYLINAQIYKAQISNNHICYKN